jgi:hypothetical protein
MTTKLALTGICALAMFVNFGCTSTKTASNNSSNDAKVVKNDQTLPAVAEAPRRPSWGSNISPYFN